MKNAQSKSEERKKPLLFKEPMVGSDRLGYALEVRKLRCVVWFESNWQLNCNKWWGSVSFNNITIETITNSADTKQAAADAIEQWFVEFAQEILKKHRDK